MIIIPDGLTQAEENSVHTEKAMTSLIRFPFNDRKALAAATFLLFLSGGRMNYMKLIKLMYLSDRISLLKFRRPITGDRYVAMKLGPVLSNVYDHIKNGTWDRYLIKENRYNVRLVSDPLTGPLSEDEINILQEVWEYCRKHDQWQLSDLTHDLPEWQETPKDKDIPVERILQALGKKKKEIDEIRYEAEEESFFEEVFSDP